MRTIQLEEVSITATRTWRDGGKRKQRTRKFWQTPNPFNRNMDGSIKTREQIMQEITQEAAQWHPEKEQP